MNMNIKIKDNIATITCSGEDGTTYKDVSISKLCQILASTAKTSKTEIPPDCRVVYENKDRRLYVFIKPSFIGNAALRWESRDTNTYGSHTDKIPRDNPQYDNNTRVFKIPYPATAIAVCVTKTKDGYNFVKMWCFALKTTLGNVNNLELCYWPFTNVYDDCHVCIGNIPQTYTNLEQVGCIPNYVFSGVSNHDLEAGRGRLNTDVVFGNGKKAERGFQLMVKLDGETIFPADILVPIDKFSVTMDNIANTIGTVYC